MLKITMLVDSIILRHPNGVDVLFDCENLTGVFLDPESRPAGIVAEVTAITLPDVKTGDPLLLRHFRATMNVGDLAAEGIDFIKAERHNGRLSVIIY